MIEFIQDNIILIVLSLSNAAFVAISINYYYEIDTLRHRIRFLNALIKSFEGMVKIERMDVNRNLNHRDISHDEIQEAIKEFEEKSRTS